INATLATLSYTEQGAFTSDTLTVATQDQNTNPLFTTTSTVPITVTEVLDASNTVPSSISVTEGQAFNFTGVNALTISDPDATGTITTTLSVLHGTLAATASGSAHVSNSGTGSVTITGSQTDINATLATLGYTEQGAFTSDTLTVATQDQNTNPLFTTASTVQIGVTVTHDVSNTVPSSISVTEGQAFNFTGANAITISDPDATGTITTTLSVLHGTLAATASGSAHVSNSGTGSVTITGSQTDINATLATLSYTEQGAFPSDTLTVATQDQNTNPLFTTTSTVQIGVTVTHDVSNTVPSSISVIEGQAFNFTGANAITISDPDATGTITTTLSVL